MTRPCVGFGVCPRFSVLEYDSRELTWMVWCGSGHKVREPHASRPRSRAFATQHLVAASTGL